MELAYIPSPTRNVWFVGPVPLRAYAIAIIVGIVVAVWVAERRWAARGGQSGMVADIAVWAVIFGLVGGRLYHVLTDPELYFGTGRHPVDALKIWQGGLGIWGAVALGAVGAWIGARRRKVRFAVFADAAAPGVALAQAVGRIGNWFNNELYGHATTKPWGLTVYQIDPTTHRATEIAGKPVVIGHFQPTFLYEMVWDVVVAGVVVWADRRFRLGRGRAFALYAMAYTAGRVWVELLRVDQANHFLGLRLNVWTSAVVFLAALVFFVLRRGPREQGVELSGPDTAPAAAAADSGGTPVDGGEGLPGEAAVTAGTADGTGGRVQDSLDALRQPARAEESAAGDGVSDRPAETAAPADAVARDGAAAGGDAG